MKRIANALLQVSGWLLIASLAGLFAAGAGGFFLPDEPGVWAFFTVSALGFILAVLLLLLGLALDEESDRRALIKLRNEPHPTIRFDPIEKEPDYNRSVTEWFFNGPELRHKGDDFRKGFDARAMVPPPGKKP